MVKTFPFSLPSKLRRKSFLRKGKFSVYLVLKLALFITIQTMFTTMFITIQTVHVA